MRKPMLPLLALIMGATIQTSASAAPTLCESVPSYCEYVPAEDAPEYFGAVCYSTATDVAIVKATPKCPVGHAEMFLVHGEVVDPGNGVVAGYIPLANACGAGFCAAFVPHDDPQESTICCENGGSCWPGANCGGVLYWCHDGVSNEDGTVTCFDAEQA